MSGPASSSATATAWCRWMTPTRRTSGSAPFWTACRTVIERTCGAASSPRPALAGRVPLSQRLDQPHARDRRLEPTQRLRRLSGKRRDRGLVDTALLEPGDEIGGPLLDGVAAQCL